MTFNNAPWAVDGARTTAALARQAVYSSGAKDSGIVKPGDLKVLPLAVPGNGLRITAGAANVLNWYQTSPSEAYTVSNPSTHTVLAADMPAAVPATSYYLVCVVVGDPEFNQSGHPFMPSDIAPEEAADFDYVRVVVVPCSSTTTRFEQLGLDYPAYALARLAVPPSTTTITGAMITDLRQLSQPRSDRQVLYGNPPGQTFGAQMDEWAQMPLFQPYVHIPDWATHCTIIANLNSMNAWGAWYGKVRVALGGTYGPEIVQDTPITSTDDAYRFNVQIVWTADVSAWQNLDKQITTEIIKTSPAPTDSLTRIETQYSTQVVFDVNFFERAV
jgi:hypothetical protein